MTSKPLILTCGHIETTIAPHRGAIVTSLRIDGRELLYFDEATFNDPAKNVRGGIPLLFPTPGKLENDRWSYGVAIRDASAARICAQPALDDRSNG
ncbi:MAG TPA: hypothetical protein VIL28_00910 [Steroidobacteraceae bacterium]